MCVTLPVPQAILESRNPGKVIQMVKDMEVLVRRSSVRAGVPNLISGGRAVKDGSGLFFLLPNGSSLTMGFIRQVHIRVHGCTFSASIRLI